MDLTPSLKAQAIAAAIYTTTGIQAQVVNRVGQPPLVTFSDDNRQAMTDYIQKSIDQKSDVEIDTLPVVLPIVIKKLALPVGIAAAVLFFGGYIVAKI